KAISEAVAMSRVDPRAVDYTTWATVLTSCQSTGGAGPSPSATRRRQIIETAGLHDFFDTLLRLPDRSSPDAFATHLRGRLRHRPRSREEPGELAPRLEERPPAARLHDVLRLEPA